VEYDEVSSRRLLVMPQAAVTGAHSSLHVLTLQLLLHVLQPWVMQQAAGITTHILALRTAGTPQVDNRQVEVC
jgi:hypothetical protein